MFLLSILTTFQKENLHFYKWVFLIIINKKLRWKSKLPSEVVKLQHRRWWFNYKGRWNL